MDDDFYRDEHSCSRLAYAPKMLPDELLYSWIARLYRHRGNPVISHFLTDLFGRYQVRAAFDVPNHLNALSRRLPVGMEASGSELALHRTLFPYFVSYGSSALRQRVLQAMLGSGQPFAQRLLSLSSFAVKIDRLRFCPHCNEEMFRDYGE